jgi:hypothetical protein
VTGPAREGDPAATDARPRISTPLTELLGIRHPVVQTGMGWVSDATLTAATSAAGGLGILAGAPMGMAELEAEVAKIKSLTGEPFGVNLRADNPEVGAAIDLLIRERVKVASFALAPKPELIARLKEAGVVVVPSIGAVRHAEKVAEWGADAVVVQGGEGGGHTGPVPTSLLLPAVVDAVDIPVIAAGGYFDGRGLVAALAYGAVGVAMGTRFLLTRESPVLDSVKQRYLGASVTDAGAPAGADGRPGAGPGAGQRAHPLRPGDPQRGRLPAPLRHQLARHGARGAGDEALARAVLEPGGDGGERADALPRRPPRGARGRRRHRQRPGGRADRGHPQLRRVDRSNRRRGGGGAEEV